MSAVAALALAALVQPAPAVDAFALRQAQPAAFAAEIERLRGQWRERPMRFTEGERLAQLLLARDARSAGDYRRRTAELAAHRARLRSEVADALAGRARTEWLNGRWLNRAALARDPDARELFRRVFADQYQLQRPAPEAIAPAVAAAAYDDVRTLARSNAEWLKAVTDRIGWFDISRYGPDASMAAWLIVQHSDHDPAWQAAMLERLRARAERGDMQPRYVAYLVDRVAVNEGRPQTYGTQGRCVGPNEWQPHPLADPDAVERLRAEAGLDPLATYRAQFDCMDVG